MNKESARASNVIAGRTVTLQSFTFAAQEPDAPDGFGAYHDLYAHGSNVALAGERFYARFQAHRFPRMVVFDRFLHGLVHSRDATRVRRDGFDHVNLHLLLAGTLWGGVPGDEGRVAPGEILLFDTTRPQSSRAEHAHVVTIALARDQVEGPLRAFRAFHGAVLPEASAGLLADLMVSLARRGAAIDPQAAAGAGRALAMLLAGALGDRSVAGLDADMDEHSMRLRRERAEAFIAARLSDPALDAETIARGIGVSRSILYRSFSGEGGVANVLRLRRLESLRACLRRPTETRSIAALAFACGFGSESHCNRAFHAAFGQPPGQFRADLQRARASRARIAEDRSQLAAWLCELY
ncbi:helix-turn-helix domain-containing protein [Methylobacterium sp. E-041]|uniref:helix-turn-helix domain-containing protein n=1 Tax=Methylobacterium sp. E-041 TaxID=2836573 RepID=UPI001FBB975C|nr:helix-turn-helix domain-containing protein [Methylobacterium sp. E-041]MCJ2105056.1 helix-turn-helix domain-containing protein [Methylobacterium sp. E-041]